MLYSQQIKNIVSGISQQPAILRLPEQLDEQINGFSTEAGGLQKRPPTVFLNSLSAAIPTHDAPLMHFVNRDEHERYIMYFYRDSLTIYGLDGSIKTLRIQEDAAYLKTNQPRSDLRVITIADHTFILNRRITTRMTDAKSPNSFQTQGALIHVKQGQYGRTYRIFDGDKCIADHATPDGSDKSHTKLIDTHYITTQLAEAVKKNGYTVEVGNTWLRIYGIRKVSTQDGFNNQALIGTVGHIQRFSSLPETAPNGYVVKVAGDPKNGAGSYYVTYDKDENIWKECAAPNIAIALDPATMPHALVREADGTFTFCRKEWNERGAGDDDSNPLPSFVGKPLNDIFFYRNRLGFLSGENVILSESAEYFNFWMTTANDILDTDCIDVPTTTSRINILNYAVPFNQSLYCFSDSTQFVLSSDTVLSPKNCALVEATGFGASVHCRPIVAGKNLYFPSERAQYTAIKEYYSVQNVAEEKNAQDITAHVTHYIPNGVYQMTSNTNEGLMLFLSTGEASAIYVYKYLFLNENRVQASWSKWDMGAHVYGAFFIASTLYVLLNRGDKHVLERMDFTGNTLDFAHSEPYRVYLDSKKIAQTGVYHRDFDYTEYDLQEEYGRKDFKDTPTFALVTMDGAYETVPQNALVDGYKLRVQGDRTIQPALLGIPYTFHICLSPPFLRQEDRNGGTRAITNGRLQIRTIELQYADTGAFTAHVTVGGHTYTYRMTNKEIGRMIFGQMHLATGTFRIPVQAENTAFTLHITSEMPLPVNLIGYIWKGSFVPRTKGV